ncbi:MAG: hypothetical protein HRT68_07595 [Flavobacteriaceae bacterium]|nr:hypothetical protein [Flavobacteriaceae bacterium]
MKKYTIVLMILFVTLGAYAQPTGGGLEPVDGFVSAVKSSFRPIPGAKYMLSAWVSEHNVEVTLGGSFPTTVETDISYTQVPSFTNSSIKVSFNVYGSESPTFYEFFPKGKIIDKWQRISGEVTIPDNATSIKIELISKEGTEVTSFFDDIRFHPFNGNLKSFVYDPVNQRLMAELDENNYATFYEYDSEGGLIRVKKETEKGIQTIQETRSNTKKD